MEAIIELQGNVLRWRVGHMPVHNDRPPERQDGDIRGWSRRSRRRLLDVLNTMVIPSGAQVVFGSYTYHECVRDYRKVSRDWSAYRKFLVRRGLAGVWVRELQKRGAIHLHVLAYSGSVLDVRELEAHWARIVDDSDEDLKRYGAKIQVVDARARAVGYLAKYVTKSEDTFTGRKWGVFGQLQIAPKEVVVVEKEVVGCIKALVQEQGLGWSEYQQGHAIRGFAYCGELGSGQNRFARALEDYLDVQIAGLSGLSM